ncbi:MAG: hypothetical protein NWF04_05245 [Candidatus Bathyarchaeota archaeon]|nr:hypothetical protein [Candidatus Bathyarchaeota archaeon]
MFVGVAASVLASSFGSAATGKELFRFTNTINSNNHLYISSLQKIKPLKRLNITAKEVA